MTAWVLVAVTVAACVGFVGVAAARPELRSLAFRNPLRRRAQSVLIVSGVVIATAVITSAGVVGDSLRASVRRSAVTQLGPVDEEVLTSGLASGRLVQSAIDRSTAGQGLGTLPLLSLSTTVVGRDFVARVAQAQVLEVDFAQAARFGGDPAATGISGATPTGDRAVIGADLADWTSIAPGHRMTVEAYGVSRTFIIDRVVPRLGVAGLAPVAQSFGSLSLNLFVPPGTIASMLRQARGATGSVAPVSVLAISNGPRRPYDAAESARVSAHLRTVLPRGVDARVQPVKQLLLADADARSSRFTQLFRAFGFFSAVAGLLLLVLTALMLARDRARAFGILRANGLRRARQIAALSLEGWLYAIMGAVAGAGLGAGLADLVVVSARSVFATQTAGRVELVFSARASSVVAAGAVGFLAALVVMVTAAIVMSRRNIVRMIKGLADPPRALAMRRWRVLGAALAAAGIATLVAGLVTANGVASVAGPAICAIGMVTLVHGPGRTRWVVSVAAASVFVWSALVVTVVRHAFSGLDLATIATEGIVMCAAAVAVVSVNHAALTRRVSDPRGRRGLAAGLGLAYSRTAPRRTTLIVSMFAVAVFTLTLLLTVGQLYSHNVDGVAHRLGGAAALEVSSDATRPVPTRDVAQLPGVTRVVETSAINGELRDGASTAPVPVTVVGFDDAFVGHGSPPLAGARGEARFEAVARDPGSVIVGSDLRADLQSGLPGRSVRVGDRVDVADPLTGRSRSLTVVGVVEQARWAGVDHVYAARAVADDLGGGPAPANLLYVQTGVGTNNEVVAAIVDGTHLPNGAYARSFRTLAGDTLTAQRQFLDIGAGYASVGLLADLVGIGVLMVDRVRERRRQIAMLRALGFRGGIVRRAFRVEAAVIAFEGIGVGVVTGVVLAWRLGASGGLGRRLAFSLPIVPLVAIVAAVIVASLVATTAPARRAGRLRPAGALRADE